jgi:membrane protease YdiL (CAAX protease family)
MFWANWSLTLLLGSSLSTLAALGEEIGWRGFLQPALQERRSPFVSTLFVGLVWGYWHVPVNLHGLNDPIHPVLNAWIIFPAASVLLAFPFAWLRQTCGSVWPAAICHGAGDAILGGAPIIATSWSADMGSLLAATCAISLPFAVTSWKAGRCDAARSCDSPPKR